MLASHQLLVARQADQARPRQMAWLIDGDNISPRLMPQVFAAATAEGNLTLRRAYGDWRSARFSPWSRTCHEYSIEQIQVTPFRKGKNATDMQLTIDAMELCLTGLVDSFCIVSGDSDFAPLAYRLREHAMYVFGIGSATAVSSAFTAACNRYQRIHNVPQRPFPVAGERDTAVRETEDHSWISLVNSACAKSHEEDGWVNLGGAGNHIRQLQPNFDAKSYGFPRLADLIASRPDLFEIEDRRPSPTVAPAYWVRVRASQAKEASKSAIEPEPPQPSQGPPSWARLITQTYAHSITPDGWMPLTWASERIKDLRPGFRPQQYGFGGLLEMLESEPDLFRIDQRTPPEGGPPVAFTRPAYRLTVPTRVRSGDRVSA